LELKLTPGGVSWYGRTCPDQHRYSFYQISTPYGTGYHVDSIGSSESSFAFLGWNKLTDDSSEDYMVGGDGRIRVTGYFRQSDTFTPGLQPGRREAYIYIMYSENLNNIVRQVRVLNYTDGTNWKYREVTIDGLAPLKAIKIGVGRWDGWATDWQLAVEWTGIVVIRPTAINVTLESFPTTDTYWRYHGWNLDRPLPADFWNYQCDWFRTTSERFTDVTIVYVFPGSHYIEYGNSGYVPDYAWHARMYINGALVAEGDVGRYNHLVANFISAG
jgi:hypothetical protein